MCPCHHLTATVTAPSPSGNLLLQATLFTVHSQEVLALTYWRAGKSATKDKDDLRVRYTQLSHVDSGVQHVGLGRYDPSRLWYHTLQDITATWTSAAAAGPFLSSVNSNPCKYACKAALYRNHCHAWLQEPLHYYQENNTNHNTGYVLLSCDESGLQVL